MQDGKLHKDCERKNGKVGYFDEFWASPPETPSSKAGQFLSLHFGHQ
jgi:hypothetical protein